MVADSMETMLADGSIIEMMAELKQQDHGLWQKICEWFKDLADKFRAVVDAYKGVQPDSIRWEFLVESIWRQTAGTMENLAKTTVAEENYRKIIDEAVQAVIDDVAASLGDSGRILVRESGTEPVIRVMVEAASDAVCEKHVNDVIEVIKAKGHTA